MDDERIEITDEIREHVKAEIERTGAGIFKLMRGRKDMPEGFRSESVMQIARGQGTTIKRSHIDYAFALWRETIPHLVASKAERRAVRERLNRLGIGPGTVFVNDDPPEGLKPHQIYGWLNSPTSKIRKDHVDWFLGALADLEAAVAEGDKDISLPKKRQGCPELDMDLTAVHRKDLADWQARTGIGPFRLLSGRNDVPPGLSANMVRRWTKGTARKTYSGYYDYVRATYEAAIPLKRLSLEDRNRLYAQKEHAGSWDKLLARLRPHADDLTADLLASWAVGNAATARQDLWDFVSERLCLADEESQIPQQGQARSGYVQIPQQTIIDMQSRMRALRRGSISLLKGRDDIPRGLKPGTVDRWFNRENPATKPEYLTYFLKVLDAAEPKAEPKTHRKTLAGRLGLNEDAHWK